MVCGNFSSQMEAPCGVLVGKSGLNEDRCGHVVGINVL